MRFAPILKRVAATAAEMVPGGLYYLTDMVGPGGALFLAAAGRFEAV